VTTTTLPPLRLTSEQLRFVASGVGMDDLPSVLAVRPPHRTIEDRAAARDRAADELATGKLIVDGVVHPELGSMLWTLQRPDRQIAMRLVTPEGIARVAAARRGRLGVLARRTGDDVVLRSIDNGVELPCVAAVLLAELPPSRPADVETVAAPMAELSESLTGTTDPIELADRIRALGADSHAAMLLGAALGSRQAYAEIVYYALDEAHDRVTRSPAAVAVFYTKRGRIVAAPSASPTRMLWTTVKSGSDHAVTQAIGQLVTLTGHRWDPGSDGWCR
jgi:hypothetical protein